jgi:hypothetical protein
MTLRILASHHVAEEDRPMAEVAPPNETSEVVVDDAHEDGDLRAEDHSQLGDKHDRPLVIIEAVLLALVAVLAAWSGFASARWSTESSLALAKASAARSEANRAQVSGLVTKNFDASTFNSWFTAYILGNQRAETVAEGRFRPGFRVAFDAWLATDPLTNPHAPPGPTYMPQYVQPGQAQSAALDATANSLYSKGSGDGNTSDNYVRTTIYLASVLFLVGISSHFAVRSARVGLLGVGGVLLLFSVISLILLPKPSL